MNIIKVIKKITDYFFKMNDADIKLLEWYHDEIIEALDKKDYQRANFLMKELDYPHSQYKHFGFF
jgi:hypothetical protein